jgi:hypothetical protein
VKKTSASSYDTEEAPIAELPDNQSDSGHGISVNRSDLTSQQGLLDAMRSQPGLVSQSKEKNDEVNGMENKIEVNRLPEIPRVLDSTLVWALYRKKEWWPAQVILSSDCQQGHDILKPILSRKIRL